MQSAGGIVLKDDGFKKTQGKSFWKTLVNRPDFSSVVALVVLILFFSIFTDSFFTGPNIFGLLRNSALYIFIAIGQAIVLCVGGMNISIGAVGALSTVVCGFLFQEMGLSTVPVIILTLLTGAITGLINGLIITKLHINAFVVTLSTMYVFQGLANGISKGYPYTEIPPSFTELGRGAIGKVVPLLFVLVLILLILVWVFFRYSVLGRRMLATGGNAEAAKLLGVRTDRIIIFANVLSNTFSALAALLWISRLGSATAATGTDWMLISNAVSVIGGTALSGGVISPLGILCSGILLAIIKNGLIMIEVNAYFEQTFIGMLILIAVAMDSVRNGYSLFKKRKKK